MAPLNPDRAHVIATIAGELAVYPHEMHFAVGSPGKRRIAERNNASTGQPIVTHHAPQRRAGEEFEADHRTDGVTGQPEYRYAVQATEGERLRGLDRDLHPRHVGDRPEDGFDHVVVAHRHSPTRHDRVTLGGR